MPRLRARRDSARSRLALACLCLALHVHHIRRLCRLLRCRAAVCRGLHRLLGALRPGHRGRCFLAARQARRRLLIFHVILQLIVVRLASCAASNHPDQPVCVAWWSCCPSWEALLFCCV